MKNLPSNVRAKAIEVANEMVADGSDEGRAIRVAIGRAKRWVSRPSRSGKRRRPGKTPANRARRVPQRGRPETRIAKASHLGGSTG